MGHMPYSSHGGSTFDSVGKFIRTIDSENVERVLRITQVLKDGNTLGSVDCRDAGGQYYILMQLPVGMNVPREVAAGMTYYRLDGIKVDGEHVRARPCFVLPV